MWFVKRTHISMTVGVVHDMVCEKNTHAMTLVDPCVVFGKNTHPMTLVILVCEKNTHPMTLVVVSKMSTHAMTPVTLVDPCVVCEDKAHAMTLVVVSKKSTHAMTLVYP